MDMVASFGQLGPGGPNTEGDSFVVARPPPFTYLAPDPCRSRATVISEMRHRRPLRCRGLGAVR